MAKKAIEYGNRGMPFEQLIEYANLEYEMRGVATIGKIPTPVTVFKVEHGRISDGVYAKKGSVDYTGSYQKRPIWYDAKSTLEMTRFPLSFVHEHQVERLIKHQKSGAVCFFLFSFDKHNKFYLMSLQNFLYYWNRRSQGKKGFQSIPYEDFAIYGFEVTATPRSALDYLKAVDYLIKAEHHSAS